MKKMKIAVLDFHCNSVDIITVDEMLINKKYKGDVESFLITDCEYNPDNIRWIAGDNLKLNLDMTEKSFGGNEEFEWQPEKKHFQLFNEHFGIGKYDIDEILVCSPEIFGDKEEYDLTMKFYDGYAIEERQDDEPPLILLYPTLKEVEHWDVLKSGILEYVQGAENNDIIPHDSALKWGVLFRVNDLKNKNIVPNKHLALILP